MSGARMACGPMRAATRGCFCPTIFAIVLDIPSSRSTFPATTLKPFCRRVIDALRKVVPRTLFFFEGPPIPVGTPPPWDIDPPTPAGPRQETAIPIRWCMRRTGTTG